ncbi:hypothetical protein N234_34970 [Ralstonia pickettii DTP0602]|nr:hypothetical protein N234_34970 [Ralstonia pickettii DTP0602]
MVYSFVPLPGRRGIARALQVSSLAAGMASVASVASMAWAA